MLDKMFQRLDLATAGVGIAIHLLIYFLIRIGAGPFRGLLSMEEPLFLLLAWGLGLIAGGFAAAWAGMLNTNGNWTGVLIAGVLAELSLIRLLPSLLQVESRSFAKLLAEALPDMVSSPSEHWTIIGMFILPIPLMLLGALLQCKLGPTEHTTAES